MADRRKIAIPISGIDTSTPDHAVADGKCKTLYNLRYHDGAWRNVHDWNQSLYTFNTHLEAGTAILTPDDGDSDLELVLYFSNSTLEIGTMVYIPPMTSSNKTILPQFIGEITQVSTDEYGQYRGKITRGNKVWSFVDLTLQAEIEDAWSDVQIIYKHADRYLGYIQKYDRNYNITICAICVLHQTNQAFVPTQIIHSETIEGVANTDIIYFENIFHFGKIIHIQSSISNEPLWFLWNGEEYALYQIDGIHFEIDEQAETYAPLIEEIDSIRDIELEDGASIYNYFVRAVNIDMHQGVLRTYNKDEAWRGSVCYFLAARDENGTILAQSPLRILSSCSNLTHTKEWKGEPIDGVAQTEYFTGQVEPAALKTYSKNSTLYGGILAGGAGVPIEDLSAYSKAQLLNEGTSPTTLYAKFDVEFSLQNYQASNIFDIAVYCTTIYPIFSPESMFKALPDFALAGQPLINNKWIAAREAYSDDDLPNQPFFLAHTIPYANLTNGKGRVLFDRTLLENIETKGLVYEAQHSEHDFIMHNQKEINNSLHAYNITTRFRRPYNEVGEMTKHGTPPDYNPDDPNSPEFFIAPLKYMSATIDVGSKLYHAPMAMLQLKQIDAGPIDGFSCGNIISYPDYRATTLSIATDTSSANDNDKLIVNYPLKAATAINYAYYIPPVGKYSEVKYARIWPSRNEPEEGYWNFTDKDTSFSSENQLWASADNKPVNFPFSRVNTIGTEFNKILAINSAAIELSDAKYGEFPTYVFTEEGVYALQSGRDMLYSAIVSINDDIIINPNTLAVNGKILYFTNNGLHAISRNGLELLSTPIHDDRGRIPDWMRTVQMIYMSEWNEILCINLPRNTIYTLSLNSGVWTTRHIPSGYILNSGELVDTHNGKIYNLREEESELDKPMDYAISTRPIKLGSMELKRAETIIVRFECDTEQTLLVEVEGSIDTQNWETLRELEGVHTNKDILIRRTPCSVKYLRFLIRGEVTDDIRILAFEVEYYNRMRHRMR